MVKQTLESDLEVTRTSKPMTVIKLKDNDELINVTVSQEKTLFVSKRGYYLNILTNEIPLVGPKASGVKGINLKEDNSFFYNAYFKAEKCSFLAKHLYFRRRHEESITQKFDKDKFDIVKAANAILNVFIQNNTYETYKPYVINHTFSMLLEWFSKLPLRLKNDFYKFIKANFRGFHDLFDDFNEKFN